MNSIERIYHYIYDLPQEKPSTFIEGASLEPPANWPTEGKVKFDNLSLKYRPELDPVVHNLTFEIQPKQKVGVVGRTGAGKSTIVSSIFRMVEPLEGTILIDGVDISKIGLADLRSNLAIIPQAPILFGMYNEPFNINSLVSVTIFN
jgi:ABC-type multidrug transport system fused ATPase/permease subunit